MVLIDLNLLIGATMLRMPQHVGAKSRLDGVLQGDEEVGLPWAVIVGYVRITTNPRAMTNPFTLDEAFAQIDGWLALPNVSVLHPTAEHARHFAEQCRAAKATGNLVSDAHLAALAVEYDCELASNDADYGRFPSLRWINPLRAD